MFFCVPVSRATFVFVRVTLRRRLCVALFWCVWCFKVLLCVRVDSTNEMFGKKECGKNNDDGSAETCQSFVQQQTPDQLPEDSVEKKQICRVDIIAQDLSSLIYLQDNHKVFLIQNIFGKLLYSLHLTVLGFRRRVESAMERSKNIVCNWSWNGVISASPMQKSCRIQWDFAKTLGRTIYMD